MNARSRFLKEHQAHGITAGNALPDVSAACGPFVDVPLDHYIRGRVAISGLPRRSALRLVSRLIERVLEMEKKNSE